MYIGTEGVAHGFLHFSICAWSTWPLNGSAPDRAGTETIPQCCWSCGRQRGLWSFPPSGMREAFRSVGQRRATKPPERRLFPWHSRGEAIPATRSQAHPHAGQQERDRGILCRAGVTLCLTPHWSRRPTARDFWVVRISFVCGPQLTAGVRLTHVLGDRD
jgi:hypothetical protein